MNSKALSFDAIKPTTVFSLMMICSSVKRDSTKSCSAIFFHSPSTVMTTWCPVDSIRSILNRYLLGSALLGRLSTFDSLVKNRSNKNFKALVRFLESEQWDRSHKGVFEAFFCLDELTIFEPWPWILGDWWTNEIRTCDLKFQVVHCLLCAHKTGKLRTNTPLLGTLLDRIDKVRTVILFCHDWLVV